MLGWFVCLRLGNRVYSYMLGILTPTLYWQKVGTLSLNSQRKSACLVCTRLQRIISKLIFNYDLLPDYSYESRTSAISTIIQLMLQLFMPTHLSVVPSKLYPILYITSTHIKFRLYFSKTIILVFTLPYFNDFILDVITKTINRSKLSILNALDKLNFSQLLSVEKM